MEKSFQRTITRTVGYHYLVYLPKNNSLHTPSPLLLFLHGAGERGSDIELVKKHGPPKLIEHGEEFPFIVVSPQCPADSWWDTETLSALLDEIILEYAVDTNRIYITGLSMGGFGTWALGAAWPGRFAALAPVCGGGEAISAFRMKDVPIWAFHGARDQIVPIGRSQEMISALERAGGKPKFTVYPEAEHDSWTETYNNPELYSWLLSHKRR